LLEEHGNKVHYQIIFSAFHKLANDSLIRKHLKEISIEIDRANECSLTDTENEEIFRQSKLTPEEIC